MITECFFGWNVTLMTSRSIIFRKVILKLKSVLYSMLRQMELIYFYPKLPLLVASQCLNVLEKETVLCELLISKSIYFYTLFLQVLITFMSFVTAATL